MAVSEPRVLDHGQWHLPYVDQPSSKLTPDSWFTDWRKISVARCARVSYLTHDGKRDSSKDLELFDRLVSR